MDNDLILSDHEEKTCQFCFKVAMLYNRRERLIADDNIKLGVALDPGIKKLIADLKQWLLKE